MRRLEEAKAPTGLAKRMVKREKSLHERKVTRKAGAVPPSKASSSNTTASVPMMITNTMRKQLAEEAGMTEAQIKALKPAEAHAILAKTPSGAPTLNAQTASAAPKSAPAASPATAPTDSGSVRNGRSSADATTKASAKDSSSSSSSSAPPQSMAGPAVGGVVGGSIALLGAGYYFFDEEDEDSPLNMVVRMIRGSDNGSPDGSKASGIKDPSEMTLEEYDAWQAEQKNDGFQQLLNEVKAKNKKAAELQKAQAPSSMDSVTTGTEQDAIAAGGEAPKRELTMMEKLEQAKQRGATAGVSERELEQARRKRAMEARRKAIEEQQKQAEDALEAERKAEAAAAAGAKGPSEPASASSSSYATDPNKPEMPEWMQREKQQQRGSSAATRGPSSPEPVSQKKRTQNEALLDGMQSLLEAKRDEERAYKARFDTGGSSFFGGGGNRGRNGRRRDNAKPAPIMLQKFKDDKAKIKAQMKEVRKAIALEKKESS